MSQQAIASLAGAGVVVFCGFLIRGFTGFGAILFTLPLLALWMPVRTIVPLLAALSIVNGAWLAWRARGAVDRKECGWLLVGAVPGVAAGVLLFQFAQDQALRQGLGAAIAVTGAWLLSRADRVGGSWSLTWAVPAGGASGFLGGLFGLSGPPPVVYLAGRPLESSRLRATLLVTLLAIDVLRGGAYVALGAAEPSTWLVGFALFPLSVLGSWLGERMHRRVSEKAFRRAISVLLIVIGVVLLLGPASGRKGPTE